MLTQLGHAFAQLDCVLSLADASYDLQFVRPDIVEDNVLFIKVSGAGRYVEYVSFIVLCYLQNGRHPLQQIIVNTFVPNDTAVSSGIALHCGCFRKLSRPLVVIFSKVSYHPAVLQVAWLSFLERTIAENPCTSSKQVRRGLCFLRVETVSLVIGVVTDRVPGRYAQALSRTWLRSVALCLLNERF
jgi:hypothetical protein